MGRGMQGCFGARACKGPKSQHVLCVTAACSFIYLIKEQLVQAFNLLNDMDSETTEGRHCPSSDNGVDTNATVPGVWERKHLECTTRQLVQLHQ